MSLLIVKKKKKKSCANLKSKAKILWPLAQAVYQMTSRWSPCSVQIAKGAATSSALVLLLHTGSASGFPSNQLVCFLFLVAQLKKTSIAKPLCRCLVLLIRFTLHDHRKMDKHRERMISDECLSHTWPYELVCGCLFLHTKCGEARWQTDNFATLTP